MKSIKNMPKSIKIGILIGIPPFNRSGVVFSVTDLEELQLSVSSRRADFELQKAKANAVKTQCRSLEIAVAQVMKSGACKARSDLKLDEYSHQALLRHTFRLFFRFLIYFN